ncbi:hypothetical protein [Agrococcus sp. ARC_14]|uniref:hypothetical protein n=1 Tax=Agrococcus sp. ARC_14 TaxID=2919927 RepID=UPI001F052A12|nr:hypothetical protein [Agrococcus sp. ARC_14]MCH1883852.1 hypothetical protein [Agrococcus sp. ARC_14]
MRTTSMSRTRALQPSALPRGSRMLAAVVLVGAAALVTGCAIQQNTPGAPSEPISPPVAIVGDDPVSIDDARLETSGLMDEVSEQGVAVRWAVPGESIAVFVGGSGSGGGCIPQPHAAGLERNAPSIVVRFDPTDPDLMCTMDFRVHGWELGLAEAVDGAQPVRVRLVNLQGDDAALDLQLGPDDLLDEPADPQPSEIPDAGEAPAPTAIPAAQLPDDPGLDPMQDPAVAVRWIDPGVSLAVLLGGSGSEQCVPQPIGATSTGPGLVELAFESTTADVDCSADFRTYGWRVTLPEAISATMPVSVTITGAGSDGASATVTVQPDDVLELP